jgi:hypothetical protein
MEMKFVLSIILLDGISDMVNYLRRDFVAHPEEWKQTPIDAPQFRQIKPPSIQPLQFWKTRTHPLTEIHAFVLILPDSV